MILRNGKTLEGEREIYSSQEIDQGYARICLEPFAQADSHALNEIMNADLVVLGPGGLYTSLIPNLLVEGIPKALRETQAKKVFVVNLMNRHGQTTRFTAGQHLKEIEQFIGRNIFDYILINSGQPPEALVQAYAEEGTLVGNDLNDVDTNDDANDSTDDNADDKAKGKAQVIATNLLSTELKEQQKGDGLKRNLIRHDPQKLARELMAIVDNL
jgi:uncharacterized cofD-like protein